MIYFSKPSSFLTNRTSSWSNRAVSRRVGGTISAVRSSCLGASVSAASLPHRSSSLIRANDRWSLRVEGETDCLRRHHRHVQTAQGCTRFSERSRTFDISLPSDKQECRQQRNSLSKQQTNVSSDKKAITLSIIVMEPPAVLNISGKHLSGPY